MPRLLLRGEYYDSVAPSSLFEDDYERLLVANGRDLYPAWHLVRFKKMVESEFGSARADLALVDHRYRKWWVVEVELGSHSLAGHVEPQVRALANGRYGDSHADALHAAMPGLNQGALREMVLGEQPRVLVLVNEAKPDWIAPLRRWGARVGIIEIFRSHRGVDVLRINGEHPEELGDIISVCRVDPVLRRSLVVASPAALPPSGDETVKIFLEGGLTDWRRVDSADRVWLMPIRRAPLPAGTTDFQLIQDPAGRLVLLPLAQR